MPIAAELVGRAYPVDHTLEVTAERVNAFAAALGHTGAGVPPTFPIVLAFDAMQTFLDAEQIELHRIVHGEQRFTYERALVVGDVLTATLVVRSLRQIGGADVVGTASEFRDATGELVCTGTATLVHSAGGETA